MQKEEQSMDVQKVRVQSPAEAYPGVCNLCFLREHPTIDCSFSTVLYHATNLSSLKSIVEGGFNAKTGRLGRALYCSDEQTMCIRYVLKNMHKFKEPVIMKVKAMLTDIKIVQTSEEAKRFVQQQREKDKKIECIKCPYFKVGSEIQYEFAIYDAEYAIVGWNRIKLPESLKKEESIQTNHIKVSNPIEHTSEEQKEKEEKSNSILENEKQLISQILTKENVEKSPSEIKTESKNDKMVEEKEENFSSVQSSSKPFLKEEISPQIPTLENNAKVKTLKSKKKEKKDAEKTKLIKKDKTNKEKQNFCHEPEKLMQT